MSKLENLINLGLGQFGVALRRNRPRRDANALFLMKCAERGISTILDVGANRGQFVADIRRRGWNGRVVSFEPLVDAHAALGLASAGDSNWHVHPRMAIGASDATTIINQTENSVSSSLLKPTEAAIGMTPTAAVVKQVEIAVRTLDGERSSDWIGPLAMKIDTQGFEMSVIEGAAIVLKSVEVLQIEMSLAMLYEGGGRPWQVFKAMENKGFRCIAVPETLADTVREEILQIDAIFVRETRGTAA